MTSSVRDHRALGGLRFVSAATGLPVERPLRVSVPGVRLVANRRGLWAILGAAGFEAAAEAFENQPAVAPVEFLGLVEDPAEEFLPRRFAFTLPRVADPANPVPNWLFSPIDVSLHLAPGAPMMRTWAVLRASLRNAATGAPLAGALVRVVPALDGAVPREGMTQLLHDPRSPGRDNPTAGELLVALPGIPVSTWGPDDGQVLIQSVPVQLEVRFAPDAARIPNPDVVRATAVLAADPDQLSVSFGRTSSAGVINVVVPP